MMLKQKEKRERGCECRTAAAAAVGHGRLAEEPAVQEAMNFGSVRQV